MTHWNERQPILHVGHVLSLAVFLTIVAATLAVGVARALARGHGHEVERR